MKPSHLLITESALDAALVGGSFYSSSMLPSSEGSIHQFTVNDLTLGYRTASEPDNPLLALIGIEWLKLLQSEGGGPSEAYRRVARVIKGMRAPPIHLPRQWSEYHHRNLLTFFALPRDVSNFRWVVDIKGDARCARFDYLTSTGDEIDLASFLPTAWPSNFDAAVSSLLSRQVQQAGEELPKGMAHEFDLMTIGSGSVVEGRTYEEWLTLLSDSQRELLQNDVSASIRIIGPAGSGKTLSLCMRAIQVSRNEEVRAQAKRVLVATHSWAMSERIDGVLSTLNGGVSPSGITVFPLLSLLELHAGHIGQQKASIIGDDSTDGRVKSLDIINHVLGTLDASKHPKVSSWIQTALTAVRDSRQRIDLTLDLYEELTGVLTASGVAPDDQESIQSYLGGPREDWMPPFDSVADRGFVIAVFRSFMQDLIDRAAITTDQFILDSIRVLETFTWRMRKETEGYDYIFIDELQLFDPQERTALELLGRSRRGVPFVTAEDPAQGVFSALNARRATIENVPVYLEVVHRFNTQIFEFISFIYQQFPLNALPLRIQDSRSAGRERPKMLTFVDEAEAIAGTAKLVQNIHTASGVNDRVCVATLGDVEADIAQHLEALKLNVTKLESFDDVERLAYSRKSIVVAPWQFIGGTQFTHVVVLALGLSKPNSQFGRLREMVSVYLSCSRATESLDVICSGYIPAVISDAAAEGLLVASSSA